MAKEKYSLVIAFESLDQTFSKSGIFDISMIRPELTKVFVIF